MQYLTIIKTVLTLLPLILDTVRAIEAALPAGGQGAQKLALVRQAVQAGFEAATDAAVTFEAVWPALEKTVGAVVGLFNTVGAFGKKG